ncbi:MAG: succinylglutamate desuccinylase, partial [Acetomicrobium sp.]
MSNKLKYVKILTLLFMGIFAVISGYDFYIHRHFKEPVVPSSALTEVRHLSDYEPSLKGTVNDSNIYVFD